MHCSTPFYIRDWSIHFGVLELIPHRYLRDNCSLVLEEVKNYIHFFLTTQGWKGGARGCWLALLILSLFKGGLDFSLLNLIIPFLGVYLFLLQVDITASSIPELERQIEKLSKVLCFSSLRNCRSGLGEN